MVLADLLGKTVVSQKHMHDYASNMLLSKQSSLLYSVLFQEALNFIKLISNFM